MYEVEVTLKKKQNKTWSHLDVESNTSDISLKCFFLTYLRSKTYKIKKTKTYSFTNFFFLLFQHNSKKPLL